MTRRFAAADLPDVVPVFPLPLALLLPRARLPLNIFEPRYLAMLDDALKSEHRLIGMVQPHEGSGVPPALHEVGCAGRVTSFSETEDGRYLIALTGVSRFRIMREIEGFAPYRRVEAGWAGYAGDLGGQEEDPGFDRDGFMLKLERYFRAAHLSSDWGSLRDAETEMLVNSLAMLCPFAMEEKQALLEAADLTERRRTLVALIDFAIAGARGEGGGNVQ